MDSTTALPPSADRLARGYDSDGVTPIPYWHQIFRPFAAINSTLSDMSRLLRVLINKGSMATGWATTTGTATVLNSAAMAATLTATCQDWVTPTIITAATFW